MSYSPPKYWIERGKVFEQEAVTQHWWGVENEPLLDLLSRLTFSSVLEVGCGFGRVGASIVERWPVTYTGMDVSPDLVAATQRRIPSAEVICADLATWQTDRQWDLVVAVSVLGHILPEDVGQVLRKMRHWARRDLVTIDWDETGQSTAYQFAHPYHRLYPKRVKRTPLGRLAMYHLHAP